MIVFFQNQDVFSKENISYESYRLFFHYFGGIKNVSSAGNLGMNSPRNPGIWNTKNSFIL